MPGRLLGLVVILCALSAHAQTQVRGMVMDAETKLPLPGVTVRVPQASLGTSSGQDGVFSLSVPGGPQYDTLLLSRLGYTSISVAVSTLRPGQACLLYLHQQQAALSPVIVTARQWVERKVGITNAKALVHFIDGTLPAGKPVEIAQLMRVGSAGAALTSINLYLASDQPDSLTLAVRFYRVVDGHPASLLAEHPICQRVAIRQGWLRLDITSHHVYLTQDVVLGLTLLPDSGARHPVPLDIKLGGGAHSFMRLVGEPTWHVPPHHYRLYITARMPAHALPVGASEAENQETPATSRLYSAAVQDSFSLFIQLPKSYAHVPNRRYPVVILLDANVYFNQVGDALHRLPERETAILVGVGRQTFLQQDSLRQQDYTYPTALPADSMPLSGGGRQFLLFLERELLPYLDCSYRTDTTQRTLMGHSLGGYFTLFALAEALRTNTYSFTRYVAASPSLCYYNQYLLQQFATFEHPNLPHSLAVYMTIGGQEMNDPVAGASDKSAFQRGLALLSAPHLSVVVLTHTVYPTYNHLETAIPTFTTGLKKRW